MKIVNTAYITRFLFKQDYWSGLFYMHMIFDMFTAVTETAALPAVSKFHTRMRLIGNAAGCAAMKRFLLC